MVWVVDFVMVSLEDGVLEDGPDPELVRDCVLVSLMVLDGVRLIVGVRVTGADILCELVGVFVCVGAPDPMAPDEGVWVDVLEGVLDSEMVRDGVRVLEGLSEGVLLCEDDPECDPLLEGELDWVVELVRLIDGVGVPVADLDSVVVGLGERVCVPVDDALSEMEPDLESVALEVGVDVCELDGVLDIVSEIVTELLTLMDVLSDRVPDGVSLCELDMLAVLDMVGLSVGMDDCEFVGVSVMVAVLELDPIVETDQELDMDPLGEIVLVGVCVGLIEILAVAVSDCVAVSLFDIELLMETVDDSLRLGELVSVVVVVIETVGVLDLLKLTLAVFEDVKEVDGVFEGLTDLLFVGEGVFDALGSSMNTEICR
jgi:hypothetical protein